MRWFVYTDVIGALSSTTDSHDYLLTSNDLSTYEPLESLTMLHEIDKMEDETQYPKKTIDYLMGFNIKFLPHFTKITILVRETNAHLGKTKASAANLPLEIVYKALEVKEAPNRNAEERRRVHLTKSRKIIELKSEMDNNCMLTTCHKKQLPLLERMIFYDLRIKYFVTLVNTLVSTSSFDP